MGQSMDDKIRQITDMLNNPDAQEGIRQLFSSLNRSQDYAPASYDGDYAGNAAENTGNAGQLMLRDTDWIRRIQNLLNQVNSIEDSRINLLNSIQPFLNPVRRERCATCLNILKIAGIIRNFTNNGGRLL
ncbi:hypothetical protein ODU73_002583 [Thermoclostridium stercorarium]|nr:hypothetical protein [Thermoclostridium stercorarium]AGI40448.1 hypothetical protein Clst_2428 [Thermoclostridium stercorarium subsp. stercorarium DSM 8532]UZQ85440.1 hypothetical protein ODU73_002583 [Thermoclostridium stercorarium]